MFIDNDDITKGTSFFQKALDSAYKANNNLLCATIRSSCATSLVSLKQWDAAIQTFLPAVSFATQSECKNLLCGNE